MFSRLTCSYSGASLLPTGNSHIIFIKDKSTASRPSTTAPKKSLILNSSFFDRLFCEWSCTLNWRDCTVRLVVRAGRRLCSCLGDESPILNHTVNTDFSITSVLRLPVPDRHHSPTEDVERRLAKIAVSKFSSKEIYIDGSKNKTREGEEEDDDEKNNTPTGPVSQTSLSGGDA